MPVPKGGRTTGWLGGAGSLGGGGAFLSEPYCLTIEPAGGAVVGNGRGLLWMSLILLCVPIFGLFVDRLLLLVVLRPTLTFAGPEK